MMTDTTNNFIFNISDPLLTPKRLRNMYNVPSTQTASNSKNGLGIDVDCHCAELVITATVDKKTYTCMFPVTSIQDDCYEIFDLQVEGGLCTNLILENLNNSNGIWTTDAQCAAVLGQGPSFWSNCTCDKLTPITLSNGTTQCSVQGYEYNPANGEAFLADYPTSSPYVTSVGATALQYNLNQCQDTYLDAEIYAMGNEAAAYGGGGGFSSVNEMPTYQTTVVSKYLKDNANSLPPSSTYNPKNRAYPDVAANGHNFMIHIGLSALMEGQFPSLGLQGSVMAVGGTSASAPTFAGLISLVNDIQLANKKPTLGFLNPMLYKFADKYPTVFHDIIPETVSILNSTFTEGTNTRCTSTYCCEFGFPVSAGWDAGTGLGTINFQELVKAVASMAADKETNNKVSIN